MRQNVVLVDNQIFFRNTARKLISSLPDAHLVGVFATGQELLDFMDKNTIPDIIFTEFDLPDIKGEELIKRIFARNSRAIIIGLCLQNNPEMVKKYIKQGARGYLVKLSNNKNIMTEILKAPSKRIFYSETVKRKTAKKRQKIILVVDDFETNTYVVGVTLQTAGYKVIKAENGKGGLLIANTQDTHLDLIVADYNMPDINGAQMIKQIRTLEKYKNIPALILSSDNSVDKKRFAESVGISAWIQKPYKIAHFLKIVDMALK